MKTAPIFSRVRSWLYTWAILAIMSIPGGLYGASSYSGTIAGVFSDPILTGFFINFNTGAHIDLDNTSTAVYSGFGTNSITSGDNPLGTGPSAITFNGASFSDVQPGEVFNVGTLSFHNGISDATTFTFGGLLTLNISGTSVPVDPLTTKFDLLATAGDPNLPPPTPEENADLIQLNFLPGSGLYAFEGQTVTANLFGSIVGDPQLNITGIELAPGQEGNGFIGPAVSTPDTGTTLLLFASALMVIVSARYKLLARS